MSIDKKRRTLSETITSIDDPIELSQKGQVVFTKSASTTAFIPTAIATPKVVTVVPHMVNFARNASAAATVIPVPYAELNTALTPESGLKLYTPASALAGGSYVTSASVKNCKLGQIFLDGTDYDLYRMKALKTASNAASNATMGAIFASASRKAVFVEAIPYTDSVKFIKLLDITAGTTLAFSFEVKGY
jgi:hypothetical protein